MSRRTGRNRSSKSKNRRESGRSSRKGRRYQKDALMNRMEQSQQQAEGGRGVLLDNAEVTIWRPKDGFHTIDIIPYEVGKNNVEGDKPGSAHYCFRYFFHRNIGPANNWVICPLKTWGKDCPICDERQRLIDNNADWDKVIKPLFPRERYLYNIVCYDRGEEKKGVQIWDVSNHYFQKHIIKLSKKPARGGKEEHQILFFDEEEGKSITFTIEPAQSKDDYPEYVAHAFEDRDYIIGDDVLDQAQCLDEIIQIYSYDELSKMFFGRSGDKTNDRNDDTDDSNLEDLLDDLEDIEDNEDLIDFCEDNDIDVELKSHKRHFEKNMEAVKEALEDMIDKKADTVASGKDEDEDDYTIEDIEDMNMRQLKKLISEEGLDINPKKFDEDDLRDEIIEELGLND